MLRSIGEAPVIYDPSMAKRTVNNIEGFYFDRGYFNVEGIVESCFRRTGRYRGVFGADIAPVCDRQRYTDINETLRELYERTRDKSLIKSGENIPVPTWKAR